MDEKCQDAISHMYVWKEHQDVSRKLEPRMTMWSGTRSQARNCEKRQASCAIAASPSSPSHWLGRKASNASRMRITSEALLSFTKRKSLHLQIRLHTKISYHLSQKARVCPQFHFSPSSNPTLFYSSSSSSSSSSSMPSAASTSNVGA